MLAPDTLGRLCAAKVAANAPSGVSPVTLALTCVAGGQVSGVGSQKGPQDAGSPAVVSLEVELSVVSTVVVSRSLLVELLVDVWPVLSAPVVVAGGGPLEVGPGSPEASLVGSGAGAVLPELVDVSAGAGDSGPHARDRGSKKLPNIRRFEYGMGLPPTRPIPRRSMIDPAFTCGTR
jgi:hypothetical protein